MGIKTLEYELTNRKLKYAFRLFDSEGNGSISIEEMQFLLSGILETV